MMGRLCRMDRCLREGGLGGSQRFGRVRNCTRRRKGGKGDGKGWGEGIQRLNEHPQRGRDVEVLRFLYYISILTRLLF